MESVCDEQQVNCAKAADSDCNPNSPDIDRKLYLILSDLTGPGFRSHLRLGKLLSMIFALQIRTEFSIAI